MSYDLAFVPKAPGQDWEDALAAGRAAAAAAPDPAVFDRLVTAAREILGAVQVSPPELGDEESGVRLGLAAGRAVITVPFGHTGAAAREALAKAYRLGAVVERETGLAGYDPQLDRGLDDPTTAVAVYERVSAGL
ncbi:hypothetical protein [Spirilliplanes yamanashiensis]|uniref:Uncharacterized protein n=1 Tax=Spirilliplanes yamanashiensis TaxID=42233 RepID=A0A8J4DJH5_9ACTN|nr:hypothetical protein [Spirilliplanes yamanashiensis]MDP9815582.1 hypothetical protein [Spirilliplanes yamanashiensis]GIJ03836.1 hypothetical protein Sya03_31880 [Spirilliplanes yamanashiensis]